MVYHNSHIVEIYLALMGKASILEKSSDDIFHATTCLIRVLTQVIDNMSHCGNYLANLCIITYLRVLGCACCQYLHPYNSLLSHPFLHHLIPN